MSIHKKILEIRKSIGTIPKNGWNDFHKYSYAKANDIIEAVKPVLDNHGVVVYPIEVEGLEITTKQKLNSGTGEVYDDGYIERWTQVFELVDVESETSKIVKVRCAGEDKGDKSAYKGNTGALKYLFINIFELDTEDDPERDSASKPPANGQPPRNSQQDDEKPWLNKTEYKSDELTKEWKQVVARITKDPSALPKVYDHYKVNKESRAELEQIADEAKNTNAAKAQGNDAPF